jgi:hypothetical protein
MPRLIAIVLACFIGLVLLMPAPASAQFGVGAQAFDAGNQITRRGVENYARLLRLDNEQKQVALTLLEGSQAEFQTEKTKLQAAINAIQEKIQDTGDFSLYQKDMPKVGMEFGKKAEEIEKAFFDDLKLSLNDEQLALWPKVERYRRRETLLRFAFVSGAAVDLVRITENLRGAPLGELQGVLDQYELDMDKKLVILEKSGKEAQEDMLKGNAMFDMAKLETMMKGLYEIARDVREINRDYARKISQVLSEEQRVSFDGEFNRRSFPKVYRQPHVVKMMEAALAFKDLDASQKEAIASLKSGYERDAAPANHKWAKAVESREEAAGGAIMVMMKSMMGGGDLNKEVNEAREARKEMDDRVKDRLTALLNDDQKGRLPEATPDPMANNPMADFMPNEEDYVEKD